MALKKIFFVVILIVAGFAMATAGVRDPHSDKNLVNFYAHQGYEYFLKKDTLTLESEESPYVISFYYMVYDNIRPEKTNWSKENKMAFAYDVEERKVYFVDDNGNLSFLNPNGTIAEGSGYAQGAEIVYYLAFGEKFYGTYDNDFYNSIE